MDKSKIHQWLTQNAKNSSAQYFLERFESLSEAQLSDIHFIAFEATTNQKKEFQTNKLQSMQAKLAQLKHLKIEAKQTICAHREAAQEAQEEKIEADLLTELANAN